MFKKHLISSLKRTSTRQPGGPLKHVTEKQIDYLCTGQMFIWLLQDA